MSSAWGVSFGSAWGNAWGSVTADDGLSIVNATAGPVEPSYEICQRSGFKFPRGTLIQEWTNLWVAPQFAEPRNVQDFVRDRAELLEGSKRPEHDTVFITTRVLPEDL